MQMYMLLFWIVIPLRLKYEYDSALSAHITSVIEVYIDLGERSY